jgi:hypothetical protein
VKLGCRSPFVDHVVVQVFDTDELLGWCLATTNDRTKDVGDLDNDALMGLVFVEDLLKGCFLSRTVKFGEC